MTNCATEATGWTGSKTAIDFWREFVPAPESPARIIAVENIFEKEPSTLRGLLEAIDDPGFRHCFDVGHWNMFTTVSLEEWFAELGPFMVEAISMTTMARPMNTCRPARARLISICSSIC